MGRGRPTKGVDHVDGLPGTTEDRERLKLVLLTMTGEMTVKEASERLSMSPARFASVRRQALLGAIEALAPGRPGRPRKEDGESPEVSALRERVDWLEEELQCARLRTEIALAMPHLLRSAMNVPPEKKGSSADAPHDRRRRGDERSAT